MGTGLTPLQSLIGFLTRPWFALRLTPRIMREIVWTLRAAMLFRLMRQVGLNDDEQQAMLDRLTTTPKPAGRLSFRLTKPLG